MSEEEAPQPKPLEFYSRFAFNAMIDQLLEKACQKHERLLRKKRDWQMDDAVKEDIRHGANQLARDWLYHASLFAMYRTECQTAEQLKRKKVKLEEDDLDLAWKSLGN